jgi:uncharacterized C2H2 Zn-finger protein
MDDQNMPEMMTCEHCGQTFPSQEELDRHMQETHPDKMGGGMGGDMPQQS